MEGVLKLSLDEALKVANEVNFSKGGGLVPVVVQDAFTKEVLMQAYMDREALIKTLTTGLMHYWSRSRGRLWLKGESSGHYQRVLEFYLDCDKDALLFKVEQVGVCCHEGFYTCFHNRASPKAEMSPTSGPAIMAEVFEVVKDRIRNPKPGSYVSSLTSRGVNAVAKKVGEELVELLLAAKEGDKRGLAYEAADLLFHVMVLLASMGVELSEVLEELRSRRAKGLAKELYAKREGSSS